VARSESLALPVALADSGILRLAVRLRVGLPVAEPGDGFTRSLSLRLCFAVPALTLARRCYYYSSATRTP